MSEPPADVGPPVEVGAHDIQAAPRRIGHRWVDLAIAVAAISISLISLFVAIQQGQTERKLLAASSWPFLNYVTERDGLAPDPVLVLLRIENAGVGPARLRSMVVRYKGAVVHSHAELLAACCGLPPASQAQEIALGLSNKNSPIGIYPARESVTFLGWRRTTAGAAVWDRLDQARHQLTFDLCYCSVLGECWRSDLKQTSDPKPVEQCPAAGPDDYRD